MTTTAKIRYKAENILDALKLPTSRPPLPSAAFCACCRMTGATKFSMSTANGERAPAHLSTRHENDSSQDIGATYAREMIIALIGRVCTGLSRSTHMRYPNATTES